LRARLLLGLPLVPVLLVSTLAVVFCQQQTHRHFTDYHVLPNNGVLMPRVGAPAILTSGSRFEAYFNPGPRAEKEWGVRLRSPFGEYEAKVIDVVLSELQHVWKLSAEVPREVKRDLYDLVVYSRQEPALSLVERNSVFIVGESFPEVLRVGVITDLHYGVGAYYATTMKILHRTLDTLSALDLDLIIGTGDIVDATSEEPPFSSIAVELSRLRIPILLAVGNNDYYAVEKGVYHWEKHLGPQYYSVRFGMYYFLILNSRNGSVDEEQLFWAEKDLSVQPKESFKVLVLHHPYWQESHPSLSVRVPNLIKAHEIRLVLMGHIHRDEAKLEPTLSLVSVALSEINAGYRLLNLTRLGVEYTEKGRPYNMVDVDYLQRNDHTSEGFAASLRNSLSTAQLLRLTFLLRSPIAESIPKVDGGELSKLMTAREPGGRASAEVRLTLPPQSERLVKVFFKEDTAPPQVSISLNVDGTTVSIVPSVLDVGFGIARLTISYSDDNSTWKVVPLRVVDRIERYFFTATKAMMYVKLEAVDAAGLKTTKWASVRVPDLQPKQPELAPSPLQLAAPIVVTLVLLALMGLLIRRRKLSR